MVTCNKIGSCASAGCGECLARRNSDIYLPLPVTIYGCSVFKGSFVKDSETSSFASLDDRLMDVKKTLEIERIFLHENIASEINALKNLFSSMSHYVDEHGRQLRDTRDRLRVTEIHVKHLIDG